MSDITDDEFETILRSVRARARLLGQGRAKLKGVSCFCATSVRVPRALATLRHCAELCEFDEIVLATHESVAAGHDQNLRVVPIPRMEDKQSYSQFILDNLKNIVRTDYVLVVQDDGFILNPGAWDDTFYGFDYIGAPWPPTVHFSSNLEVVHLKNRVGNGGFSFRSQRLLQECSVNQLFRPEYGTLNEDMLISHFNHDDLVSKGIKFANVALASRFAGETPSGGTLHLDGVFGFHGKLVMKALVAKIRAK